MHEVPEGDINAIARPAVIFSPNNELKIPDIADAKTDLP